MAEIKDFEGLEKALGELMLEKGTGPFHEEINYYNVLGLINSLKVWVRKEVLDLFDGKIGWECQCPPERRGAEMALIRVLIGKDWEDTNKLTFTIASKKELRSILEGEGGEKKE